MSESLPDGTLRTWSYTDGRMTEFSDSSVGSSTVAYDAAGRVVSTAGAENWTFDYDAAGQLVFAQLDDRTWVYGYDADGNLVSVDDSVEGLTTYTVDAASRITGGADADGALAFDYDPAGRLLSTTAGDGTVTSYSYDVRGLPVAVESSGDPCLTAEPTIAGTEGDDTLIGTSGADIIFGFGGNDVIDALGGVDIVCGGDGDDEIFGRGGADYLVGGDGADIILGNGGADVILGGIGSDQIVGGWGADVIFGNAGADIIGGDVGNDLIVAGGGADQVTGSTGDDSMFGGRGHDDLRGNEDDDQIFGGRGDDVIRGGFGNAVLDGDVGTNDARGNSGIDTCDDSGSHSSCETVTALGDTNLTAEPVSTEYSLAVTSTQSRSYDGLGSLVEVDIDGATNEFVWDHSLAVPQIVEMTDASGSADVLYGLTRLAELTDSSASVAGYSVLGDSTDRGVAFDPFGTALTDPADAIGFGFRGELHIGGQVHLRARDLLPELGRFATIDPLDGVVGTVVETNPYHYANNDPVNLLDPLGLRPGDNDFVVCGVIVTYSGCNVAGRWGDYGYSGGADGHLILDGIGTIPVIGMFADAANTIWYAVEGDWVNASISAAAFVPVVGTSAACARHCDVVLDFSRATDTLPSGAHRIDDAPNGARGLSPLGGVIEQTGTNSAGGRIFTSTGAINQNDFAGVVNSGLTRGDDVHIFTGAHGLPNGSLVTDASLLADDVARFGDIPGVYIHDLPTMSPAQVREILDGPGTIIGGFCDSGACLAGFGG